ncbi:MAG: DUF72 domain-containing protein [Nannocystaceae bacterium]|nr:DUF72 domain-containing protein [Myxococcales bacterium]
MDPERQIDMFGGTAQAASPVGPATPPADVAALPLPAGVRFGTSSWAYPGWAGIVYDRRHSQDRLAKHGLAAYARHPLLRCVGVDRSYYAPPPAEALAAYAAAVPSGFQFLVKAHDACTIPVWPRHARYGARRGQANERFLDPAYAAAAVVEPTVAGLRDKLGALLFQFSPLDIRLLGGPARFAARLEGFLAGLPRGPRYAVELRSPELLTDEYAAALLEHGVCHCVNGYPGMPPLEEQYERARVAYAPSLVVRWMLHDGMRHEQAGAAFDPFDRLVEEDPATRRALGRLCQRAQRALQPALVIINNNAEGCAPRSIAAVVAWMAEHPE